MATVYSCALWLGDSWTATQAQRETHGVHVIVVSRGLWVPAGDGVGKPKMLRASVGCRGDDSASTQGAPAGHRQGLPKGSGLRAQKQESDGRTESSEKSRRCLQGRASAEKPRGASRGRLMPSLGQCLSRATCKPETQDVAKSQARDPRVLGWDLQFHCPPRRECPRPGQGAVTRPLSFLLAQPMGPSCPHCGQISPTSISQIPSPAPQQTFPEPRKCHPASFSVVRSPAALRCS